MSFLAIPLAHNLRDITCTPRSDCCSGWAPTPSMRSVRTAVIEATESTFVTVMSINFASGHIGKQCTHRFHLSRRSDRAASFARIDCHACPRRLTAGQVHADRIRGSDKRRHTSFAASAGSSCDSARKYRANIGKHDEARSGVNIRPEGSSRMVISRF